MTKFAETSQQCEGANGVMDVGISEGPAEGPAQGPAQDPAQDPSRGAGAAREWLLIAAMATVARLPLFVPALVLAVVVGLWGLLVPVVLFGLLGAVMAGRAGGGRLPGMAVRPADQPELTGLVKDVAERLGFRAPLLVRVVPTVEASLGVARVSGVRTFALVLGLPLLRRLSAAQLAAVVAHELAHEQHASDRRRAWLAGSRQSLALRVDGRFRPLAPLAAPLLRASQPRVWEPELAADADSARVAGTAAARGALELTGPLDTAFEALAGRWLSRLEEENGYPADLYQALDAALTDPYVARTAAQIAAEDDALDPYAAASHPPFARRVAALPALDGEGSYGSDPVPLRDGAAIEAWCVGSLCGVGGADGAHGPEPVRILATDPERFFRSTGEPLAELAAATGRDSRDEALDAALDAVADGSWPLLARRIEPDVRWAPPAVRATAARTVLAGCLGQVVGDALLDAGWEYQGRWLRSVLTSPDGTRVLDLNDTLTTALETRDPGPVRELLHAAGTGTGAAV
jgi:Zn-dependent protease with chaperone function